MNVSAPENGVQVLFRAAGAAIPALLAIVYLQRRKSTGSLGKWIAGVVIAFSTVGVLNVLLAVGLNSNNPSQPDQSAVQVKVVSQKAVGLADADLSNALVKQTEKFLLDSIRASVPGHQFQSRSGIVQQNGHRFGIVKITADGATAIWTAFGFVNSKLVRVTCAVADGSDVNFRDPVCQNALKANLGTVIENG